MRAAQWKQAGAGERELGRAVTFGPTAGFQFPFLFFLFPYFVFSFHSHI
jgi:hypothetical protein